MNLREDIIAVMDRQEAKGISKYGQPLTQTDREVVTALEYLQEELVDGLYYVTEAKRKIQQESFDPAEIESAPTVKMKECPRCGGMGTRHDVTYCLFTRCSLCDGTGVIPVGGSE